MKCRLLPIVTMLAFVLALSGAAAQSSGQSDTSFARYVMIMSVASGSENSCSETFTDEYGLLEQILICSGAENRGTTYSAELPLFGKFPPRLVAIALDEIKRGMLSGERELRDGRVRHHVRWNATSVDNYEIEETLLR